MTEHGLQLATEKTETDVFDKKETDEITTIVDSQLNSTIWGADSLKINEYCSAMIAVQSEVRIT